jgi:quinol monooxygenase YgiN
MYQFLEGAHQITKTVHEKEPGVLRYFAFQTKSKEGEDQVVFVEKYVISIAH